MKTFKIVPPLSDLKNISLLWRIFIAVLLTIGAYFIASALLPEDYRQALSRAGLGQSSPESHPAKCKKQCRPVGSEALPEGIVTRTSDLQMRPLWGHIENDTMTRRPADPEEELRWMSQEVRGYVEAVLNSLAANVPKAVVLCQVEKAKEDMLNKLYSSISGQSSTRIEELLQEDQNVKRKRERCEKQSALLSKLTRQLSVHDNWAAAASGMLDNDVSESSPRTSGPGDDWRTAFDAAASGPSSLSRSESNSHSRRFSDPFQNGDANSTSRSNSSSRRTPNRLPPAPPGSGASYRY